MSIKEAQAKLEMAENQCDIAVLKVRVATCNAKIADYMKQVAYHELQLQKAVENGEENRRWFTVENPKQITRLKYQAGRWRKWKKEAAEGIKALKG